jgi:hypothetical protein
MTLDFLDFSVQFSEFPPQLEFLHLSYREKAHKIKWKAASHKECLKFVVKQAVACFCHLVV